MRHIVLAVATLLASCVAAPDSVEISKMAPADLPASVVAAIATERPDFTALEVEKKVREGRVYYDVEGEIADGSELEFDVLVDGGAAQIVEIQRDLPWSAVPDEVRAIAFEASGGAAPVRIIESVQTDGAVIYELFAEGKPADPAFEVRVQDGKAELLTERWFH